LNRSSNLSLRKLRVEVNNPVIPAKAGIQRKEFTSTLRVAACSNLWIPAFAGMTVWFVVAKCQPKML